MNSRSALPLMIVLSANGQDHTPRAFIKDFLKDEKRIWTSPARMFHKEHFASKTLPLLAGTAALLAADRHLVPQTQTWGRSLSTAGAAYSLGTGTTGLFAAGKWRKNANLERMGWNGAEALANAAAVGFALKFAFGRERPDLNPHVRFLKGKQSLPSGHAMTTWAVASAVARTPGCPKWLKISSYAAASIVSVSRVAANRHSPSDVFAGGMMGAMIGGYIAAR